MSVSISIVERTSPNYKMDTPPSVHSPNLGKLAARKINKKQDLLPSVANLTEDLFHKIQSCKGNDIEQRSYAEVLAKRIVSLETSRIYLLAINQDLETTNTKTIQEIRNLKDTASKYHTISYILGLVSGICLAIIAAIIRYKASLNNVF